MRQELYKSEAVTYQLIPKNALIHYKVGTFINNIFHLHTIHLYTNNNTTQLCNISAL